MCTQLCRSINLELLKRFSIDNYYSVFEAREDFLLFVKRLINSTAKMLFLRFPSKDFLDTMEEY